MVVEYVAGLKTAWEVAKALKVATDAIDDAQIKLQMAELISALADARVEAAENAEKIAELEKALNTKADLKFDGKVYFMPDGEGPFCPTCFDKEGSLIRLQHWDDTWACFNCKHHYEK